MRILFTALTKQKSIAISEFIVKTYRKEPQ